MRLGWGHDDVHFLLVPGTQRSTSAGAHSTLHGVVFAILCPGPRGCESLQLHHAQVPGRDTSVSLLVMNSSSTGMPSLVFAMPRRIAGMMSSGFVTRSPWPPKARAIAAKSPEISVDRYFSV